MKYLFILVGLVIILGILWFAGVFSFLEPEKHYDSQSANNCVNGKYDTGDSVTIIKRQGDNCKLEIKSRNGKPVTTTGAIRVICVLPIEKIPLLRAETSQPTPEYYQYCKETSASVGSEG